MLDRQILLQSEQSNVILLRNIAARGEKSGMQRVQNVMDVRKAINATSRATMKI
jgi:hypothetical protein